MQARHSAAGEFTRPNAFPKRTAADALVTTHPGWETVPFTDRPGRDAAGHDTASSEAARYGIAHARGFAFKGNKRFDAVALARDAAQVSSEAALPAYLRELNGHFAVVIEREGWVWAAVDPLRSIPLFYRADGSQMRLAEAAHLLLHDGEPGELFQPAVAAMLKAGYTLGSDTLYPGVSELRAGEFLSVTPNTRVVDGVKHCYYFQHLHAPDETLDPQAAIEALDGVSLRVFSRAVETLAGRTCVIPLSSGYDSRYVAAMLHRLNYAPVICYTYGAPGSDEVVTARRVAEALGYPWFSVEYTPEAWRRYLESRHADAYELACGNGSALPHVQEYMALRELNERHVFPEDSVFLPGFCGDLLGGSYMPEHMGEASLLGLLRAGVSEYISRVHLSFANAIPAPMQAALLARLDETLLDYPRVLTVDDLISVHEAWFTVHKVAKFVVNSVRVYEHFGFDWLMPLWDRELYEYWYQVPHRLRQRSELYNEYLFRRVFEPLSVDYRKQPPLGESGPVKLLHALLPETVYGAARRRYQRLKLRYWPPDPNGFLLLAQLMKQRLEAKGQTVALSQTVNQVLAPYFIDRLPDLLANSVTDRAPEQELARDREQGG